MLEIKEVWLWLRVWWHVRCARHLGGAGGVAESDVGRPRIRRRHDGAGASRVGTYLRSASSIHLYSAEPCPAWLERLDLGVTVEWYSTRRLWLENTLQQANSLKEQSWSGPLPYLMAAPERAYLEVLADVPEKVSFEHADQLMQGLTSLSPRRLDVLLKGCRHIKVKRLFFFLPLAMTTAGFKHLDRKAYDLGSGKRVVAKGGRLDSEYLITVPEAFHGPE